MFSADLAALASRGSAPIQVHDGGSFILTDGEPDIAAARLFPVETWQGDIIDCVAWDPDRPERWWLHTDVGVVLGEKAIVAAGWCLGDQAIVHLYPNPATWLKAAFWGDERAVCLIANTDPRVIFGGHVAEVRCLDTTLCEWFQHHVLKFAAPTFKITARAA